jgi:hypothetical protein
VAILVFTVASVTFQLPATIAVRILGPRIMFAGVTIGFGVITLVSCYLPCCLHLKKAETEF